MKEYRDELGSFVSFSRASRDSGNKSITNTKSYANLALRNREAFPSSEAAERILVLSVTTTDCVRT